MNTINRKSKRARSNEDSKRSPAKRQFRNQNEKRRRDLFSQLIGSLEDILHIDQQSSTDDQINKKSSPSNKSDKASILRETADYLRKHHDDLIFQSNSCSLNSRTTINRTNEIVDFSWKPPSSLVTIEEWIQTTIESMNCFFLVAKSDPHNGQIVYVSQNISSLLDYSQNELLNRSLFELILPRDHDQLRDYLLKDHKVLEKCNLSWRRATADEYEQCTIIGAFRQINKQNEENNEKYLMSIVKVNTLDKSLSINNENSINKFTMRLNLQGKFIQVDSKAEEYLGYNSYELIGQTHFHFVHPDDLTIIIRAHQLWKQNGTGESDSYRFLTKGQQWIILKTNCQVQINSWTGKPENYLCTSIPLQNPSDYLHKQLSSNQTLNSDSEYNSVFRTFFNNIDKIQSRSTLNINPSNVNCSSDSQITLFLSHLGNERYRINIRERLNERKISKESEIRVREDEIKVIEDIIQFIDEFTSKHEQKLSLKSNESSSTIDLTNPTIQQDPINEINVFESNIDPTLFRSPLLNPIEDFSPEICPMISRNNLSKDPILVDPLYSPCQQETYCISSPMTPYSIPSRPSPIISMALSVSPSPISPSISSSTSSSTSTTANPNVLLTEQGSKKSTFNRSLPHSLVS